MEPVVTEQTSSFQEIHCCGKDSVFSFPVYGSEVVVNASEIDSTEANTASNKVKVSQISKFEWEERFYHGNLVSCNSSFVAYIIKSKGDKEDHVRVINHHTSSRLLLRGPQKKVVDLCFESSKSNHLACVDSEGTLFVFEIIESEDDIKCNLVLQIYRKNISEEEKQRVIWAPNLLLPMDTHESMIAISNNNGAEVYDLKKILESLGEKEDAGKEFDRDDLTVGVMILKECHTKAITCLALSPDTNVLATCSLDGDVKFWSIEQKSCLHEWEPHDGEPVTSLFFCDNLLVRDDTTPFWRYLMTGTSMSSVLKVWCAVKWECLQTIEFAPYTDQNPTSSPSMKLALDISAKFLIMADIHRPVLYICHLHQDSYKEKISVVSVSEFILKEPLLSFSIFVAKNRRNQSKDHENEGNVMINGIDADTENYTEENNESTEKKIMTSVTLFAIQKRAIQKLSIKFCTTEESYTRSISTTASSQEDVMSIRDALSDIDVSENFTDKLLLQESIDVNESSNSTISQVTENTASSVSDISTVTLNGQLSPPGDGETTLMEINNSASFINNLATSSLGDSFADALLRKSSDPESLGDSFADVLLRKTSDTEKNDIASSLIGPLTNGLTSLSLDRDPASSSVEHDPPVNSVERDPAIISLERDPAIISLERDPAILHALSIPPSDEKESSPRINSDAGTTNLKAAVILDSTMPTTDQLLMLLNNQQQVLNNQQQVLISQQQELKEMKEMMKQLISQQISPSSPTSTENEREDVKVYMQLLQKSTTSQFSKASKEFNKLCSQRLDQFLTNLNTMAQQKEEHNIQTLQNIVSNTIAIKLEKTIKQEMKQTVLNSLEKMHTKYMDNVNNQIAQKLSIWERTLKEETKELLKSKPLVESIGASAAGVLQGTIPNAFQECFQRIILPGFEKALMAIFMQMDRTFREGTKQYLESVTKHVNTNRQEAQDPLIIHMQELIQSFQATADRLTSGVETNLEALMQKQLQDALENMQNNFSKTVENRIAPSLSESISVSLTEAMEDFKRKVSESISETMFQSQQQASSDLDKKARIMALVDQGNYSKAFEEALSAANLPLVMLLCQHIEPNGLFQNSDHAFPQPIILSLIHQLSGNLTDDTEIKRRYLEESIMALDKDDEITREHLPVVLQGLNGQLNIAIEALIRTDSTNIQLKPLKMLLMASRSLLHSA